MRKKEDRLKVLKELLGKIQELRSLNHEHPEFKKWCDKAKRELRDFYGDHDQVIELESIDFSDLIFRKEGQIYRSDLEFYTNGLNKAKNILNHFIDWEIHNP